MDDLKIPVILLICIICGAGFYFYNKSQNPTTPKVKPTKTIVESVSSKETEAKEAKKKSEEEFIDKAKEVFESGNYNKTLEFLSEHQNSSDYNVQRMIAYSLSSNKEYDRAILAFEKVLKIRKVPADGYSLAYLYEITGRFSAAASIYLELAELDLPSKLKISVYEGIARISEYLPENKYFIKYIQELVNICPESKDGIMSLLKYKRKTESFDNISSLAEKVEKNFSNDYLCLYELAQLYENAGNNNDAVNAYKKCIKLDSKNYTPYLDCYRVLMKLNKRESAVSALEYYLNSEQVYPGMYFEAALTALKCQKYKPAFRLYLAAVVSDSRFLGKNDEGLVSEVEKYYKENGSEFEKSFVNAFVSYLNGDYSSSLSEIESIKTDLESSAYKTDSKLLVDACDRMLKIEKKRDDEINAYEKFIRDQEEAERQEKERLLAEAKKAKEAKEKIDYRKLSDEEIKTTVANNLNNYNIQMSAANEFFLRGKLADAKTFFGNAAKADPKSDEPHYQLAKIFTIEKNYPNAQKCIEEAIKRNSSNINTLSFASSICMNNNDPVKAKEFAELALKKSPNNSLAKITLIKVYMNQGDFEKANSLIESSLAEEKSNIVRVELQELRKQIAENSQNNQNN